MGLRNVIYTPRNSFGAKKKGERATEIKKAAGPITVDSCRSKRPYIELAQFQHAKEKTLPMEPIEDIVFQTRKTKSTAAEEKKKL